MLLGGSDGVGNVLLTCEDKRKLEMLEMPTRVAPGAQMLFRHRVRILDTASLLLRCIREFICVVRWTV